MDNSQSSTPYGALAIAYDLVMEHVDYWAWSIYIAELIDEFGSEPKTILEMGCGTGSLALNLTDLIEMSYKGFDKSPEMIAIANGKKRQTEHLEFYVDDFLSFTCNDTVDVAMLLYDGLNYLTEIEDVRTLLRNARNCLHDRSIFIFDVSTPANSIKNASFFEDYGKGDDFSYYRTSVYDSKSRLHRTVFELDIGSETFTEEHVQRAYSITTISDMLKSEGFEVIAAFEDFTFDKADDDSERVHFVTRQC